MRRRSKQRQRRMQLQKESSGLNLSRAARCTPRCCTRAMRSCAAATTLDWDRMAMPVIRRDGGRGVPDRVTSCAHVDN
eukprot:6194103-Pleurochrysis_carterae.AAC.2